MLVADRIVSGDTITTCVRVQFCGRYALKLLATKICVWVSGVSVERLAEHLAVGSVHVLPM
jgi:hypothetical protein